MKVEIPYSAGVSAITSVEVLESPPSGGLQASVKLLTTFVNHGNGKDVHTSVKDALRTIKPSGSNT